MFDSWSMKKLIGVFGLLLLVVACVQIYLFFFNFSEYVHFALSFVALFIALLLFHSVNMRLKKSRIKK